MSETLKVGIVGYGYASKTLHAPLVLTTSGLQLAAVSSRDPGKVRADLPQVEAVITPEALFARPDLDLIIIPTPNQTHAPLAAKALAAGKHVVVDKPFTLDASEAIGLIAQAKAANRLLSVFHSRRWDADFLTLKQLLASGALGRLTHFQSQYDRYRPVVPVRWRDSGEPGSGLWYDLGPHLLDQALQLFGVPDDLCVDLIWQRDGALADDGFHASLRYDRLRVILSASTLTVVPAARFILHGTHGSFVKYGLDAQEAVLKTGALPGGPGWGDDPSPGVLTTAAADGTLTERSYPGLAGDYRRYYAGVRDAILGRGDNPVPAEEALNVMRLIDLGRESYRQQCWLPVVL